MIVSKFSAALLHILLVLVAAIQVALQGPVTPTSIVQLAILAVGSFAVYLFPLTNTTLQGELKVGAAVVIALLTALIPFLTANWSLAGITAAEWVTVVLAGLSVLGTGLGVAARLTANAIQRGNPSV